MKKLIRYCATLAEAERYHARLYNRYDRVRLVEFPRWSDAGNYVWEVS